MSRKIYDIKPPKVIQKIEKDIKEILSTTASKKHRGHHKKEDKSIWRPILIIILIVVLVAGVYLFFKLPKANIVIWPKIEALSFKQTITADKSTNTIDLAKNVIPAQYFQASKTNSQDFPATGNASNEGRASGTITIYNKYDPSTPLTFKAGTHFMSDSGKLFIAPQKIVIPAAKKSGGKITPGSVQVEVKAVEGGSDYNIAPSNFSVPGLKGTSYYYSVYATSTSAMTGGYAGKVKKVTSSDIQGAKDILTQRTISDASEAIKSQISSDYILLNSALLTNVASASTQTKADAVADSFNYQVTVEASALAFKKSDLNRFAQEYVISKISQGQAIVDNSLKIDYSSTSVDVSGGKAVLNIDISSGAYQSINRNSLSLSLLGKNTNQINETINSSLGDQVSKIKVDFWPFWVTRAPNNQKAVNIELKFE